MLADKRSLHKIHHVESEQWLGSLLHANDELVTALMTFEQLDRSIDADSDSDDELAEQAHMYRSKSFLGPPTSAFSHDTNPRDLAVMSERAKSPSSPSSPTSEMARLSVTSPASPPPRPAAPPRPSAMSKPQQHLSPVPASQQGDSSPSEEEDEDDPFADRNAVVTPKVERNEPSWS